MGGGGASNAGGDEKSRFSTNISFISEMIKDRAIVTMERRYKLSNGTISNDLE